MIDFTKFPYLEMRETQKEILDKLNDNWDRFRFFVIEAPTGVGKSAIAKTVCSSFRNAFLVTATKQLQDQYIADFPDGSIKSIKGRVNYPCDFNQRLNCEIGPCMVNKQLLKECRINGNCPYYNARDKALNANVALTSYAYFLRSTECGHFWRERNVLILDECHLLEQQITSWAAFFLSPRDLHLKYNLFEEVPFDKFVGLSIPPEEAGYPINKIWLGNIWDLIVKKRDDLFKDMEISLNGKQPDDLIEEELDELISTHKDYYEIDKLYKRLHVFFSATDKESWIIEPENDGLNIQPVNVGSLFFKYVNNWASSKIIFMSATILDVKGFCEELGLPKEQTAIIRAESTFDPQKSPIVYYPTGPMNYKSLDKTLPKVLESIKDILAKYPNDKGIIHSGNYKITQAICDNINDSRLIMKDNNSNNEKLLRYHINNSNPTVLVSPSLTTGADLKDDLSRFQIMVKLPWISLTDKRVKKKIELNENWYSAEMFRSFMQASGRSTRSDNDWSITYVLDSSFYYWVHKYQHWFPKQFLKRIVWKKD